MNKKLILLVLSGFAIGYSSRPYIDTLINDVQCKIENFKNKKKLENDVNIDIHIDSCEMDKDANDTSVDTNSETHPIDNSPASSIHKLDIKEYLKHTTDYASYFNSKEDYHIADTNEIAERVSQILQKQDEKEISYISEEEFNQTDPDEDGYVVISCVYYAQNNVLVTDYDEIIDNWEDTVGSFFYNQFETDDKYLCYVKNKKRKVYYEIERVDDIYIIENND